MLVGGAQLRAIYMAVLGCDTSSVIYDLSHNFADYVMNTAGLEDVGGRSQIAGWFKQKILKIAFGSLQK